MKKFIAEIGVIAVLCLAGCSNATLKQSYSMRETGESLQGGFVQAPSVDKSRTITVQRRPASQPAATATAPQKPLRFKLEIIKGQYIITAIGA